MNYENPGRWTMTVAKAHRAALLRSGVTDPPAMIDVTVSLMIMHRKGNRIDWAQLLSLPDAELIARVSYIHDNIDRKTGEVRGDMFTPSLTP